MSGVKSGEVRQRLGKVIQAIQKQAEEQKKNTQRLTQLGAEELEQSKNEALRLAEVCKAEDSSEFELRELVESFNGLLQTGLQEAKTARDMQKSAQDCRSKSKQLLEEAQRLSKEVERILKAKDWYLEKELEQAKEARDIARQALDLESMAGDQLRSALDHICKARNSFDSAVFAGRALVAKREQARLLAEAQEKARKLAEAEERRSGMLLAEIDSLMSQAEQLKHDFFAPGELEIKIPVIASARLAHVNRDHTRCSAIADSVVGSLRELVQRVAQKQVEWEKAFKIASNDLEMAELEVAGFDVTMLETYGNDPSGLKKNLDGLKNARLAFEQNDFAQASLLCRTSLDELRKIALEAESNLASAEKMRDSAHAIMQALVDVGYDVPIHEHTQTRLDGSDDLLSSIRIFASSPNAQGDVRFEIAPGGNVTIKMDDIPQQDGAICHGIIESLQKKLGDEVELDISNWGHAQANAGEQIKIQEKEKVKDKDQTKERTKDASDR